MYAKCADLDHPAQSHTHQGLCILFIQYTGILLAHNEDSYQTAEMRSLFRAFAVRRCSEDKKVSVMSRFIANICFNFFFFF